MGTSGVLSGSIIGVFISLLILQTPDRQPEQHTFRNLPEENTMQLGAFSVSLAVRDIRVSKEFYEKLGFTEMGGNIDQNWLIMKNGVCVIGLFQGMFEKNMLTFNPGWDNDAQELPTFTDVRDLQNKLKSEGITFVSEVEEGTSGPGSFVVVDPDGNPVLFDQHR